MRRTLLILAAAAFVLAAACGGPSATTRPSPSIASGTTVAPATQPASSVGHTCANEPTFVPSASSPPTPHVDPDLEALLPTEIAGAPLQSASTRLVTFLCMQGGQGAVDHAIANTPSGISLAAMTYATASNARSARVDAFRAPGQDSGIMLQNFSRMMGAIFQGPEATPPPGRMAPISIGGKSAFLFTSGDTIAYVYARGEVLFFVVGVTEAEAATVLATLP